MQQDEHEAALKKLFKAYYFAPGDQDILRMLAWCCFLCHKYEESEKYYLKLLENSSREKDWLHAGHEAWAAACWPLSVTGVILENSRLLTSTCLTCSKETAIFWANTTSMTWTLTSCVMCWLWILNN